MSGPLSSQFNGIRFEHGRDTAWKAESGPRWSKPETIYAVSTPQHGETLQRGAIATLVHPKTYYDDHPNRDNYRTGPDVEDSDSGLYRVQAGDGPGRQGSLFDVTHRRPYIHYLVANQEYRTHAMGLLGVASVESRRRFGEDPVSSDDLSPHSQRMVGKLAEAGAAKMPEHFTSNSLDFPGYSHIEPPEEYADMGYNPTPLPDHTMGQGRHRAREILRRKRGAAEPQDPQDGPQEMAGPLPQGAYRPAPGWHDIPSALFRSRTPKSPTKSAAPSRPSGTGSKKSQQPHLFD